MFTNPVCIKVSTQIFKILAMPEGHVLPSNQTQSYFVQHLPSSAGDAGKGCWQPGKKKLEGYF